MVDFLCDGEGYLCWGFSDMLDDCIWTRLLGPKSPVRRLVRAPCKLEVWKNSVLQYLYTLSLRATF